VGRSQNTTAEHLKKVLDAVQTKYNEKLADEKKKDVNNKLKNKQKGKATLAAGKQTYERNNNPGMVNDLMGDDGYGDEDYGEEGNYRGREEEGNYDFM
jgi:hypothetical protein